jgi:hypothetical protein
MSKEAMKLALEALNVCEVDGYIPVRNTRDAIKALEESLSKQEQGEPVAWELGAEVYWGDSPEMSDYVRKEGTPLYATYHLKDDERVFNEADQVYLAYMERVCGVKS